MGSLTVFCYFLFSYIKVCICLRIVGISVPTLKQRGESSTLTCDYDLEGGRLYSVKWYRDNEEFYRYMPRLRPPQHAHKLEGVKVDLEKSTARRVHLRELTLKSRGLYRCEVSEEAPSFHSAQAEAFMEVYSSKTVVPSGVVELHYLAAFLEVATVDSGFQELQWLGMQCGGLVPKKKCYIDFPRETPRITGHERAYQLMEPLDVNCSSAKSFPAPDLQWLIDGQKITDRSWLIAFGAKPAPQGLLVSTLGLRAPTKPRMKLKCVATIGTHRRERTVVIEINSTSWKKSFSLLIMITLNIVCVKIS